jgi:diguanylate cyclase (GGDEF)-like protein
VRGADRAYRWAGDEFAVLLPETTAAEAAVVAERVRGAAASAHTCDGDPLLISYGVSELADGDPERLLRTADVALFQHKAARPPLLNPGR